ncbi:MAG: ATPase [Paracoccaceae bacterium]
MKYSSANAWETAAQKRVTLFGMSGLGKTYLSNMLSDNGDWFHYSVDYRIGTHYMNEHIVDNFKREAMQNGFLSKLLKSDSIYIASNITFENLAPLSTYLGKPGNPALGGIPFEQYITRQRQHCIAEIAASKDAVDFAAKAHDIYGYDHFICDTSGSICEVVNPDDPKDPVLCALSSATLPVWIEGDETHSQELMQRFQNAPKPMYYSEDFLQQKWTEYLRAYNIPEVDVNPDDFILWGYRELLAHRLPLYKAIAENWGVSVKADEVRAIRDPQDFQTLIATAIARNS